jgi:hypothetical protein
MLIIANGIIKALATNSSTILDASMTAAAFAGVNASEAFSPILSCRIAPGRVRIRLAELSNITTCASRKRPRISLKGGFDMSLSPQQELLESYGDQLRAKISSKFSASTFLAGFAATILTTLVTTTSGQDHKPLLQYPLALLGFTTAASILFVQAIIRLDELSMPKRFWPSRADARNRAEDVGLLVQDDLWVLHDRMVFFWRYLTLAATALTGMGLLALVLPPLPISSSSFPGVLFAFGTVSAIVAFVYVRRLDTRAPHRDKLVRPID